MKTKILLFAVALFTVNVALSQDTTYYPPQSKLIFKDKPPTPARKVTFQNKKMKTKKDPKVMYRDTRLGSSSPKYNTYKKNKYGAGGVTTNPNKIKTGKHPQIIFEQTDSIKKRD